MTILETGGSIDMHIRPISIDDSVISDNLSGISGDILERTHNGRNVRADVLSSAVGSVMRPSARSIRTHIDNGWESKRLMIAMLVSDEPIMISHRRRGTSNNIERYYVVGYTDAAEYYVGDDGHIDFPGDMRIYIDSSTRVRVSRLFERNNEILRPSIIGNDLMLRDTVSETTSSNRRSRSKRSATTMRPYDTLTRHSAWHSEATRTVQDSLGWSVEVSNGNLRTAPRPSSRDNESAPSYLARTISNYLKAASNEDSLDHIGIADMEDEDSVYKRSRNAAYRSSENIMAEIPLFDKLSNSSDILRDGYITWAELMDADPDFNPDDVPFINWESRSRETERNSLGLNMANDIGRSARNHGMSQVARSLDSASLSSNTNEAIAARIIASALPSLMIRCGYSQVDGLVLLSNPRLNEDHVNYALVHPYMDGMDIRDGELLFIDSLEQTIIPAATSNDSLEIEAFIMANVNKDIQVYIRVDGGDEHYFSWPAWAAASISSMITDRSNDLDLLSEGIGDLVEDLSLRRQRNVRRNLNLDNPDEEVEDTKPRRGRESLNLDDLKL